MVSAFRERPHLINRGREVKSMKYLPNRGRGFWTTWNAFLHVVSSLQKAALSALIYSQGRERGQPFKAFMLWASLCVTASRCIVLLKAPFSLREFRRLQTWPDCRLKPAILNGDHVLLSNCSTDKNNLPWRISRPGIGCNLMLRGMYALENHFILGLHPKKSVTRCWGPKLLAGQPYTTTGEKKHYTSRVLVWTCWILQREGALFVVALPPWLEGVNEGPLF